MSTKLQRYLRKHRKTVVGRGDGSGPPPGYTAFRFHAGGKRKKRYVIRGVRP